MLFNEPKLLKSALWRTSETRCPSFSALQRAEIAENFRTHLETRIGSSVSVLFNEPKLLKTNSARWGGCSPARFSALQRAEIAEKLGDASAGSGASGFSALQRAEIAENIFGGALDAQAAEVSVLFNEPKLLKTGQRVMFTPHPSRFSALQRAEIAEKRVPLRALLSSMRFSALQRAEIAENPRIPSINAAPSEFQCSSTSRNC